MRRAVGLLLLAAMMAECAGCGRAKPPPPADAGAVFAQIEELTRGGDTNKAIALIEKTMDDSAYAAQRPALFRGYLSLLFAAGRGEEGTQAYLARVADAELARSGYDLAIGYQMQSGRTNAVEEWTRRLMDKPLAADLDEHNVQVFAQALLARDAIGPLLELAPLCVRRFDPPAVRRILGRVAGELLGAGRYAEAGQFLDAVAAQAGGRAELGALVSVGGIELLVRQGQWPQVEERFAAAADTLADADLQRVVGLIGAEGQLRKQWDLVDRVCLAVLDKHAGSAGACREAAAQWVAAGQQRTGAGEAVTRLGSLLDRHAAPAMAASLYSDRFYSLLNTNSTEIPQRLADVGSRLAAAVPDGGLRDAVRGQVFDAAFMAGDYERSLDILQSGALGRDPAWVKMAENKLRAHMALRDGRTEEALQRFREFMDYIAANAKEAERDPITRMRYSKEMTLGLNAKRIGDLLKKAGKAAEAGKAYEEARGYFEKALESVAPDGQEGPWIKQQLADLPEENAGK